MESTQHAATTSDAMRSADEQSAVGAGSRHAAALVESSSARVGQSGQWPPKVAILLCTYQGQQFLADQLDSFAAQSYSNWGVWVSDDGSQDDTLAILEAYRIKWGDERISIHAGPAAGFAANFMSLTCRAGIAADYYAYSDQDDIWQADKLQRAMDWLRTVPQGVPALYCSRTCLVDAENREIGLSPLFVKPPSFANALMQNLGGGNTMVFNDAARSLLRMGGEDIDVVVHDWWVYLVVSGCGGKVFYDTHPTLRYRQHGGNLIGMNSNWQARFTRLKSLWRGQYRKWNDCNIQALRRLHTRLSPESKEILDRFEAARSRSLFPRLIGLKRSGIYRQTTFGNLALIAGAIFKKI